MIRPPAPVCAGDLSTVETGRSSEFRQHFFAVVIEHERFAMLRRATQVHAQTARRNIEAFMDINAA
jgi:hypothetical protein